MRENAKVQARNDERKTPLATVIFFFIFIDFNWSCSPHKNKKMIILQSLCRYKPIMIMIVIVLKDFLKEAAILTGQNENEREK